MFNNCNKKEIKDKIALFQDQLKLLGVLWREKIDHARWFDHGHY